MGIYESFTLVFFGPDGEKIKEWDLFESLGYKYIRAEGDHSRYSLVGIFPFLRDFENFEIPEQIPGCEWYVLGEHSSTYDGWTTTLSKTKVEFNLTKEQIPELKAKMKHQKQIQEVFESLDKYGISFYSPDDDRFKKIQEIQVLIDKLKVLCPDKFI